jgi:hypothetical protein
MYIYLLYFFVSVTIGIYSYALIDPNITFFQHPLWVAFRDPLVQFGYYNREGSWNVYLILVILLFLFYIIAVNNHETINPTRIALTIGIVLLFSYPFLSHDLFNYMFDAKIFTFYHQNPYLQRALDFPGDQWTRFMQWTHRTYPYGPVFLLLSLAPSFLGIGKFTLSFLLFKTFFILCYIISVHLLNTLNKRWAVIFATHPLIVIEGLVSSHNDLTALSLAIIGIYLLFKKNNAWGRLFLLFSGGVKYISAPMLLIGNSKNHRWNKVILIIQMGILIYLSLKMEIQPWYFLVLFAFLPFFEKIISSMNIFFLGLLMSYYPYIRLGGWNSAGKIDLKHQIILIFFLINVCYMCLIFFLKRYKYSYKVSTRS